MIVQSYKVEYYRTPKEKVPFREWLWSLRDEKAREIIDRRLARVRAGSFGDCVCVGEGILELRIHYGPGYRVYFGQIGKSIVLLLVGGDKKSQSSDIFKAKQYWQDYRMNL